MDARLQKQLQNLVVRQQNRIWTNRILEMSPPLMWWSAGILFAAGIIHQTWMEINMIAVVAIALLPSIILPAWMAKKLRPNLPQAAASFDKMAGANSMFVSAWEISHLTAPSKGIQGLLLARSSKCIDAWSSCFATLPRRTLPPTSLIAISAGLVGLFFLLLTPHVQSTEADKELLSEISPPFDQRNSTTRALKELLTSKPVTRSAIPEADPELMTAKSAHGVFKTDLKQDQQLPDQQASLSNRDTDETSPLNVTESMNTAVEAQNKINNSATKMAKKTAGNDTSKASDITLEKSSNFENIKNIDFNTQNNNHSVFLATSQKGMELVTSQSDEPDQPLMTAINKNTLSGAIANRFNAQQRIMVRRYFTLLEKKHESRQ